MADIYSGPAYPQFQDQQYYPYNDMAGSMSTEELWLDPSDILPSVNMHHSGSFEEDETGALVDPSNPDKADSKAQSTFLTKLFEYVLESFSFEPS